MGSLSGDVALATYQPARIESIWQQLRGLKILLPFAVLAAVWWAIKALGDIPDNLLVSPLQSWNAFVPLVTHGVMAEYPSTSPTMIGLAALISLPPGAPLALPVA